MDNLVRYITNDGKDPIFCQPDGFDIWNRDPSLLQLFRYVHHPLTYTHWTINMIRCEFKPDIFKYWLFCQLCDQFMDTLMDTLWDYIVYLYYNRGIVYDESLWTGPVDWYNWWLNAPKYQKTIPLCCDSQNPTELLIQIVYDRRDSPKDDTPQQPLFVIDVSGAIGIDPDNYLLEVITLSKHIFTCTAIPANQINGVYNTIGFGDIILGIYINPREVPYIDMCEWQCGDIKLPVDFTLTSTVMNVDKAVEFIINPSKSIILRTDGSAPLPTVKITMIDDHPLPKIYFIHSFISIHIRGECTQ